MHKEAIMQLQRLSIFRWSMRSLFLAIRSIRAPRSLTFVNNWNLLYLMDLSQTHDISIAGLLHILARNTLPLSLRRVGGWALLEASEETCN